MRATIKGMVGCDWMARRRIFEERKCPFCNETVQYWPNCAPSTCKDYYEAVYSQTKRGTKIWFHKSCYLKNTRGAQNG